MAPDVVIQVHAQDHMLHATVPQQTIHAAPTPCSLLVGLHPLLSMPRDLSHSFFLWWVALGECLPSLYRAQCTCHWWMYLLCLHLWISSACVQWSHVSWAACMGSKLPTYLSCWVMSVRTHTRLPLSSGKRLWSLWRHGCWCPQIQAGTKNFIVIAWCSTVWGVLSRYPGLQVPIDTNKYIFYLVMEWDLWHTITVFLIAWNDTCICCVQHHDSYVKQLDLCCHSSFKTQQSVSKSNWDI